MGIHFYDSEGLACQTDGCAKGKIVVLVTVNQYSKIVVKCYIAEASIHTFHSFITK